MDKTKKNLRSVKKTSRRKFITKAAVATGAVVAGGLLAGCEPQKKQAAVAKQETSSVKTCASVSLNWAMFLASSQLSPLCDGVT